MPNEPTLREQLRATFWVTPGLLAIFLISFAVGLARVMYGFATEVESFFELTGLGTPWFAPWVLACVSGLGIGVWQPEIDKQAASLVRQRLRNAYGEVH